jgi:hypothetical protein
LALLDEDRKTTAKAIKKISAVFRKTGIGTFEAEAWRSPFSKSQKMSRIFAHFGAGASKALRCDAMRCAVPVCT